MDAGNQSQPSKKIVLILLQTRCHHVSLLLWPTVRLVWGPTQTAGDLAFLMSGCSDWTSSGTGQVGIYSVFAGRCTSNCVVPVEITSRYAYFGCALWWRKLEKQQLHNKGQLYDRTEAKSWRSSVILATLASPPLRRWFYGQSSHRCGLQIPYGSHSPFTLMSR